MAAYRRVYDSRHLQVDCQEPGSAPEPYDRPSYATYVCACVCLCARLSSGMLQPGNGSRLGVPNILLIITDGQSDHPPLSWTEAIEARRQGISVIAVSSRSVHTLHTALHTHSSRAHSLTQSVLVSPMPWRIAPPPVRGPERYF